MSRIIHKVSTVARGVFSVTDANNDPVTGLVNGDFTKYLTKDGANDATAVTVTEVANGRYTVTFTPASTGHWQVWIYNATYNKNGWSEDYDVTTEGLVDVSGDVWAEVLETGFSASRVARITAAAAAGKASGGPGSPVFRNLGDTGDLITGTADADGNRTAATYGA